MGVKTGRVGFVDFINESLTKFKDDGGWVDAYDKWVKPLTTESADPPPDTATTEAAKPPVNAEAATPPA